FDGPDRLHATTTSARGVATEHSSRLFNSVTAATSRVPLYHPRSPIDRRGCPQELAGSIAAATRAERSCAHRHFGDEVTRRALAGIAAQLVGRSTTLRRSPYTVSKGRALSFRRYSTCERLVITSGGCSAASSVRNAAGDTSAGRSSSIGLESR